jgi:hypothetical protein
MLDHMRWLLAELGSKALHRRSTVTRLAIISAV